MEIDVVNGFGPDGSQGGAAAATKDTTVFRSGLASAKYNSGAGNSTSFQVHGSGTTVASRSYWYRAYMCFTNLPGSTVLVAQNASGNTIGIKLTSGGKLQLFNLSAGTQIGSDSAATISADGATWYRIELLITMNGSNQIAATELQLDGVSVASTSGLALAGTSINWRTGWLEAPGANKVCNVDDVAINDSTGAANNSWAGSGKVILMRPVSDNNRGAFTGGAGGTTNLFDAVNNTPPVGVAEASATNTSQIKNRTTTNPTNCDLNLNSYTTEGILAADTINAIQVHCNDGEDPGTGTKAGTCAMVSNPAIAASASFNYGDDVGIQGTYPGNWKWHFTSVSDAPSVTLGTQPVIRMTCTSGATGSRSASCDFLGAYVDYTPAETFIEAPSISVQQAVKRSSYY